MRMMKAAVVAVVGLLGLFSAAGQDITAEQQKLLAKRAAEADAYRKLAEMVYGLQINSRTYVQDFVTESDEIRSDVDSFVKGIRLGDPIWYDDGSCEVAAEVTVAKVVETLREAHSRHYHGSSIKTEDFESITRRIEKKVLKVVGMGAPRPDLPPDLPEAAIELLGPAPAGLRPPIPDLWRKIGPQARLSAQKAAYEDAKRRLAERIKGLRITARTQVRDFVMEGDVITSELNATLVGFEEKGYYLHNDELIAECTLVLPTEQVISTIKRLHSRHYKGDDVRGSDIENITKTIVKKEFEATGMGIPNPRFIQRYAQSAELQMPGWSMRPLEIEGHGTDEAMDTPQGRLRAARAAEMDARRKLAEQIGGLELHSATTVRDFVTEHDEIASLVDAVIVDAVVTGTRFEEGEAIVTIALPGARVWGVVNGEMQRYSR
ncbi:MAG: LPP20 family lipoprotein [Phycisphaerae bacterium]|jgi:hypothetical protein